MKYLQEFIIEKSIIIENSNSEIINEGVWRSIKKLFGKGLKKLYKLLNSDWSKASKDSYITGQYIGLKSDNNIIKDICTSLSYTNIEDISDSINQLSEKLYNINGINLADTLKEKMEKINVFNKAKEIYKKKYLRMSKKDNKD